MTDPTGLESLTDTELRRRITEDGWNADYVTEEVRRRSPILQALEAAYRVVSQADAKPVTVESFASILTCTPAEQAALDLLVRYEQMWVAAEGPFAV